MLRWCTSGVCTIAATWGEGIRVMLNVCSVVMVASALLSVACSPKPVYQSFREAGYEKDVTSSQIWSFNLPYKSGTELSIQNLGDYGLLLSDRTDKFNVTRI